MGIRFAVKGIQFIQIEDVRRSGVFLLLCGLLLIVMAIVFIVRGVRKNSGKK